MNNKLSYINKLRDFLKWLFLYSYISTPSFLFFSILLVFIFYYDTKLDFLLFLELVLVILLVLKLFQLKFKFFLIFIISIFYLLFLFFISKFYISVSDLLDTKEYTFINGCGIIQEIDDYKGQIQIANLFIENKLLTRALIIKNIPNEFIISNHFNKFNLICIKGYLKIKKIGLKVYSYYNGSIIIYQQPLIFADSIVKLRFYIDKIARMYFGSKNSIVVKSILFGIKDNELDDSNIKNLFQNLGLAHVLVASGANVLIIVSFLNFIFRKLIFKNLFLRINISFFLHFVSIVSIFAYLFIVGLEGSLIRAILFFIIYLLSQIQGREYPNYSIVFLTIILIAYLFPSLFFSLNLIFSITAIMGLLLATKIKKVLNLVSDFWKQKLMNNYWIDSFINSICILILTGFISLNFFKEINLNGIIANIILLPFIEILVYAALIFYIIQIFEFLIHIFLLYHLKLLIAKFINILTTYILDFMELLSNTFANFLIFNNLNLSDLVYFNLFYISFLVFLFLTLDYFLCIKNSNLD